MSIDEKSPMGPGEVNELIGRIRELEEENKRLHEELKHMKVERENYLSPV